MNLNPTNSLSSLNSWHIAILIPARDEEALLPRCLRSIARARAVLPRHVTSDVVLVADRCDDQTLSIARKMLRSGGVALASSFGNVGCARALAAHVALTRYAGSLDRCWLANTDADCELPVTWLNDQLSLAERHIEAVAGMVSVDSFEEHPAHVAARFRDTYFVHADGTHPHVHGANFGVRADVYRNVGGWEGMPTAEDHNLWSRLKSRGHACSSVADLKIITSGRMHGRAPQGFAEALTAHGAILPDGATA